MKREERLPRLLEALASREPAPAGGSAAAATVAIGAALLEKAALLSVGKWDGADRARQRAHELRLRAEELIERDAKAYLEYVEARRAKRNFSEEWSRTVDVPMEIERVALDVISLAHDLGRQGNPNLRPDCTTAAILAHAAISAAAMMVKVNLGVSVGDARLPEALQMMRDASASARRLGALDLTGGRGRVSARSRDSGPRSRARAARDGR